MQDAIQEGDLMDAGELPCPSCRRTRTTYEYAYGYSRQPGKSAPLEFFAGSRPGVFCTRIPGGQDPRSPQPHVVRAAPHTARCIPCGFIIPLPGLRSADNPAQAVRDAYAQAKERQSSRLSTQNL